MAKKKVVDDPATEVDESAEPYVEPTVDADGDEVTADTHICVNEVYIKHDHTKDPRPYRLSYGGQNLEHVHTDGLGVWHYRHM